MDYKLFHRYKLVLLGNRKSQVDCYQKFDYKINYIAMQSVFHAGT